MKFHAPLSTTLVLGLAFATSSFAQDATAPAVEQATETTAPAPATDASNTTIPQAVLDVIGKPEPGKALIVFFRANRFAGAAIKFKVRENEVELGKLGSGNYILAQVEPGKHTYTVHSEAKDVTNIEVEAGETYFVVGTITMGFMAGHPNLTPSTAATFETEMKKLKPSN
jgi:hypothetical protein